MKFFTRNCLLLLFCVSTSSLIAQVGIGTNTPNASAKLDITATNKGLLPPRVALTGTADVSTIASPATALLVYNTATAGSSPNNVIPGYYYYNGANWVNLITTSGVPYSGATGAVNLGAYDLTVNGLTIGKGAGQNPDNTALGVGALSSSNISGTRNTAVGSGAMQSYNGTSFDNNTSVGYQSMVRLTTGNANTSIGGETMIYLTGGSYNTSIGNHSLLNVSGNSNTAIGADAGGTVTSGGNNTFLGQSADVSSGNGTITNATAIGNGATVSASNTIQLGNGSVTTIQGAVGFTNASDIRLKENISNTKYGLATVMQFRPVDYNLKSNGLRQIGFIAQEMKKLVPEVVTGKEGDLAKGETLGITYANLVPVLTKAIQEQQKQIDELKAMVEKLLKDKK